MKKRVALVFASVWLLTLSASSSSQTWSTGTFEDALAKAKAGGKLLILDVFQEYG
jgi:hypothetical protein